MAVTDPHGNRCDRTVSVHVRELWKPPFDLMQHVACAQRFYGKYGVYFCVASIATVCATTAVHARLVNVAVARGGASPEWRELYSLYGVQQLSSITAFVVQSIHRPGSESGPLGTSSYSVDRPSVLIGANAHDWVLAHEIGHVLLWERSPRHSGGNNELMRDGPAHVTTEADPVFNERQINAMRQSPFCLPC